jgi:glutaminyl-tRNA synthetase
MRVMGVLRPLKVVITNYPEGQVDELEAINNPEDESAGTRKVPFSRVIYIDREDFMETPAPKYFRLYPGNEVRLRYAYFVKCTDVVKDAAGEITEVHCTYDPATKGGNSPPDGRKVKGTIHWVSAAHALDAEVRLYDYLFTKPNPDDVPEGADWRVNLNPNSETVLSGAKIEPSVKGAAAGTHYQFERQGYFTVDKDSTPGRLVFNRSVSLKDSWAKEQKK